MTRIDYLIIGYGIAGATLAAELRGRGRQVLVLDTPQPDSASRVAAGLINPVAGKRFALAWRAAELLPAAAAFYRAQERRLGQRFFFELPILKLFSSVGEQNSTIARSADQPWQDFVEDPGAPLPARPGVRQELGGLCIRRGGYVRVEELLTALAAEGRQEGWLRPETFDWAQLVAQPEGGYLYAGRVQARHVVCCEGAAVAQNPYFQWLPVTPNQGEVLDVACPGLPETEVLNKGAYVVPLGAGQFRVGATYRWPPFAVSTTPEARQELSQRLHELTDQPFQVTGQRAGVRPAVRDRKPLLGTHPALPNVHIFNGLGSKGVMMAPRLAQVMADWLEKDLAPWPEVNIRRYFTLYSPGPAATGPASPASRS
ncbi:glycine/D-amino acid oxidase-like deaminating enzyme [Hymenobacter luteus]|uniref:Glycine/D-amino acid oxidase-like deaminating enzyme n=2 Tax=Hymenobacter TaxID=89966 RepID=A0A7W9WD35_9BACT|nr:MULTISPECIES: FAD-dependent oxidoreductase [Hymenobacter]MBB4602807.1 glycine/D-amino acid oxidase-like deaminating enzyme [Hymenobacter latericoloratus]MBB6060698.1 glycine/D-amino acid oxidase-like deaminating enzyme [Hymenobacter luteus]